MKKLIGSKKRKLMLFQHQSNVFVDLPVKNCIQPHIKVTLNTTCAGIAMYAGTPIPTKNLYGKNIIVNIIINDLYICVNIEVPPILSAMSSPDVIFSVSISVIPIAIDSFISDICIVSVVFVSNIPLNIPIELTTPIERLKQRIKVAISFDCMKISP